MEVVSLSAINWRCQAKRLAMLPLELKKEIASIDDTVWYKMYSIDGEFRKYACSPEGCARFVDLFTVIIECDEYIEYQLFGRVHRGADLPAVIWFTPSTHIWCYNGNIHRDEMPAYIEYRGDEIIKEIWYRHGKKHRDGGLPAEMYMRNNEMINIWYIDGDRQMIPEIIDSRAHIPILVIVCILVVLIVCAFTI